MEKLNPFDDPQQRSLVLANSELQYSLWPDFSPIPPGWSAVFGPASHGECLGWLQHHWLDMRSAALRTAS
ncbi:MAG: MbtH family protein [Rouxiella aceris]|uniref:MbtH family protein n=1 Tax=Rouxiella aceris TaxID=2703884 RepID=UPI002840F163|nr:MbtH family protein [Rouxiella aceris]MDR3430436.1 MbtH family protein [Rouxiella aceris]